MARYAAGGELGRGGASNGAGTTRGERHDRYHTASPQTRGLGGGPPQVVHIFGGRYVVKRRDEDGGVAISTISSFVGT